MSEERSEGPRRLALILGLAVVFLILSGSFTCPTRLLLGVPCPGCGMTRATWALLHLDLSEALALHPLSPLLVPLFAWIVGRALLVEAGWLKRERVDPLTRAPRGFWIVLLVLVLGVWLVRFAGGLGGVVDPVEPAEGAIGHALSELLALVSSSGL